MKIRSTKLDTDLVFHRASNGYIFLEQEGNPGTLGKQIFKGGKFSGSALSCEEKDFEKVCRTWARSYVKSSEPELGYKSKRGIRYYFERNFGRTALYSFNAEMWFPKEGDTVMFVIKRFEADGTEEEIRRIIVSQDDKRIPDEFDLDARCLYELLVNFGIFEREEQDN